jgi:hypothetical protein
MFDLSDKGFNAVIIKMIRQTITSSVTETIGNLSKEIEVTTKKSQIEVIPLKNAAREKQLLDGLNSRMKMTEDRNLNKREKIRLKNEPNFRYVKNNNK